MQLITTHTARTPPKSPPGRTSFFFFSASLSPPLEILVLTHTNSCGKYGRTRPDNEESKSVLVISRLFRWMETSMNFYSNLLPNLQEAGAHEQALVQEDNAWRTSI
ncbi:hypothetical protein PIB30_026480 [Stylosanthes scabra]|uniref:Uncharacterized protein n=1 Tax=Stylosanthes scabra TaxID=79078 RepID=A0ABU6X9J4_9FABA|nr:hypothetical protein [Stylosanthes scabra]